MGSGVRPVVAREGCRGHALRAVSSCPQLPILNHPSLSTLPPHPQILEGILPKEVPRGAPPPDARLLEHHFVFACVWAFGGAMLVDKVGGPECGQREAVGSLAGG